MARFTSSAIIVSRFICFSCFLEEIVVRLCSPPTGTVGNGPPNPATFIVYLLMPGENGGSIHARTVEITKLLRAWGGGDEAALARLTEHVYPELRLMARRCMKNQ